MILEACGAGIMLAKRTSTTDTFDDFALSQFEQYGNVSTYDSAFNTTDFIDEIQQSVSASLPLVALSIVNHEASYQEVACSRFYLA